MHKQFFCTILTLLLNTIWFTACSTRDPVKIVLVSGSNIYFSNISLVDYKNYLKKNYEGIEVTLLQASGELNANGEYSDLTGLEALDDCDVALFFTRRLTLAGEQLEQLKKYVTSGGSVVALQTASHGFQNWLDFDKVVLGGNYHGHAPAKPEPYEIDVNGNRYPAGQPTGPSKSVKINPDAKNSPVLKDIENFRSRYILYRCSPVAADVDVLMTGTIPGEPPEPVVWTRIYQGARICYIGLGGLQDFENTMFKRLVTNALFWAAKREVKQKQLPLPEKRPEPAGKMSLTMRGREEISRGSDQWKEVKVNQELNIAETAILICDMWDKHWCEGATERCEQLAIKMNPVLKVAREKGMQIIHAPSSTLSFYADWPQRQRMLMAPAAQKPEEGEIIEPPLPIDDSDGGCDTGDKSYSAWTRQSPHIEIGKYDGISDNGDEIYNFFKEQGIKNMIIMGVHTNMCVLGRSFGIRQMTKWGINCILVRDLTDAMYDPEDPPFVSHEEGTGLVIQHIEKYWCPSMLSKDLVESLI